MTADEITPFTDDDIGTVLDCGCTVARIGIPCARCAREYGPAQPDCGDCRFGVPGLYHRCED